MDLLQFDDLSLFGKVALDEESLILHSKCGKYAFYINFKDEIRGVDYYDLAIVTETSSGFINKSGTASVIHKAVMDTLSSKIVTDDASKPKKTSTSKSLKYSKTSNQKNVPFYANKRGRK